MNDLLVEIVMIIYEAATVILPAIIAWMLISNFQKKQGDHRSKNRWGLYIVFSLYILGVILVTGAGTLYDILRFGLEIRAEEVNLIPFEQGGSITFYVLNAVMLVPLGFLLPILWPKTNKLSVITLFGFSFSLLIEVSQMLSRRSSDINDLIMNTLGAIIGFLIFKLFTYVRLRRKTPKDVKNNGGSLIEPAICIGCMFLGHFLFYNGIGFASVLLGF